MGVEKDYLMRQIMMLFEVLQRIFRHRKKGEKGKALDEIKYFYNCLKIERNLENLTIENFIEYLEKEKNLSNQQLELVAFVLKEQGELSDEMDNKTNYFRKAYFLLDKIERESTSFSMDRQMKLAELKEFLN